MKNIFVLMVLVSIESFPQDSNHFSIWGNIGAGLSYLKYTSGNGGFSLNYGLSSRFVKWILSAKYRNENELSSDRPNEIFNSVSLLFGLSNKLLKEDQSVELNINILSGISYIKISERGKIVRTGFFGNYHDLNKYSLVGIPIELEIEYRSSNYVGVSVSLYSNINKSKNLFGTNINLIFGYL